MPHHPSEALEFRMKILTVDIGTALRTSTCSIPACPSRTDLSWSCPPHHDGLAAHPASKFPRRPDPADWPANGRRPIGVGCNGACQAWTAHLCHGGVGSDLGRRSGARRRCGRHGPLDDEVSQLPPTSSAFNSAISISSESPRYFRASEWSWTIWKRSPLPSSITVPRPSASLTGSSDSTIWIVASGQRIRWPHSHSCRRRYLRDVPAEVSGAQRPQPGLPAGSDGYSARGGAGSDAPIRWSPGLIARS